MSFSARGASLIDAMRASGRGAIVGPLIMVFSGLSIYIGAGVAVSLFTYFPPFLVAWLRVAVAAVIMLVVVQPPQMAWSGGPLRRAVFYGFSTLLMNMTFYEAIARIPLGLAVALEFLGPVLVAAATSRSFRDGLAVVLALVGVALIAGVSSSTNAAGLFFIFLAGAMWAAYIVTGSKLADEVSDESPSVGKVRRGRWVSWRQRKKARELAESVPGSAPQVVRVSVWQSMAVGFTVATVVTSPLMLLAVPGVRASLGLHVYPGGSLGFWGLFFSVVVVGVMSSALPYALDQVVLKLVTPGTFAALSALLPLTATLIGWLMLGQVLGLFERLGVTAIVAAVALRKS